MLPDSEVYDGVLAGFGSILSTHRSGIGFHVRHNTCIPMHVRSVDHVDVLGYGGDTSAGDIDATDSIVPNIGSTGN